MAAFELRVGEGVGAQTVTDLTASPSMLARRRPARVNSLALNNGEEDDSLSPLPLTRVDGNFEAFLNSTLNSDHPVPPSELDQFIALDSLRPPSPMVSRKRSAETEPSSAKRVQVIELDQSQDEELGSPVPHVPEVTQGNYQTRIRDNITCSICKDILHNPACLVPCSHLLCGGCFVQLKKCNASMTGNGVSCPECRKKVSMIIDAPPALRSVITDYLDLHPEEKRPESAIRELDELDKSVLRGVPLALSSARAAGGDVAGWSRERTARRHAYVPVPFADQIDWSQYPPLVRFEDTIEFVSDAGLAPSSSSSSFASMQSRQRARPNHTHVDFDQAVNAFVEATMSSRSVAISRVAEASRRGQDLNAAIANYLDSSSARMAASSSSSSSSAAAGGSRRASGLGEPSTLSFDPIFLQ